MPRIHDLSIVSSTRLRPFTCLNVASPKQCINDEEVLHQIFGGDRVYQNQEFTVVCIERENKPIIEIGDKLRLWCRPAKITAKKRKLIKSLY